MISTAFPIVKSSNCKLYANLWRKQDSKRVLADCTIVTSVVKAGQLAWFIQCRLEPRVMQWPKNCESLLSCCWHCAHWLCCAMFPGEWMPWSFILWLLSICVLLHKRLPLCALLATSAASHGNGNCLTEPHRGGSVHHVEASPPMIALAIGLFPLTPFCQHPGPSALCRATCSSLHQPGGLFNNVMQHSKHMPTCCASPLLVRDCAFCNCAVQCRTVLAHQSLASSKGPLLGAAVNCLPKQQCQCWAASEMACSSWTQQKFWCCTCCGEFCKSEWQLAFLAPPWWSRKDIMDVLHLDPAHETLPKKTRQQGSLKWLRSALTHAQPRGEKSQMTVFVTKCRCKGMEMTNSLKCIGAVFVATVKKTSGCLTDKLLIVGSCISSNCDGGACFFVRHSAIHLKQKWAASRLY